MTCRKCGAQFSNDRQSCPKCGAKTRPSEGRYHRKAAAQSLHIIRFLLILAVFFGILGALLLFKARNVSKEIVSAVIEIDDALSEEKISEMQTRLKLLDGIEEIVYIPSHDNLLNARYFLVQSIAPSSQAELKGQLWSVPGVTAVDIRQEAITEQDFWNSYPYRTIQRTIPCEALAVVSSNISLTDLNQKAKVSVLCTPQDTTDILQFRSNDESVALVDNDGMVTAVAEGETTVEIICGTVCVQVPVSVYYQVNETTEPTVNDVSYEIAIPPENELFGADAFMRIHNADNLFSVLPERFTYSSGAGGWCTEIMICEDGSFEGHYFDSDLGVTGEDYPGGTCYVCNFTGAFSAPQKISDYIYSLEVSNLDYPRDIGASWTENDIRFIRAKPAGFTGVTKFCLYLPGCQMDVFSDEQLCYPGLSSEFNTLPQGMFAMYAENKKDALGFWGSYENCLWNQQYAYQYENRRSAIWPKSYTGKSALLFWPEEGAAVLNLEFLWDNEAQREFVAVDEKSGETYELNLYLKKDMSSVYVVLKSLSGTSLEAWGGTADGTLAATYTRIQEETSEEFTIDASMLKVGECITLGQYEQDNNAANGKEPIQWRVLSYDATTKKALLVSQYVLDAKAYHNGDTYPTWANSDIRNWLNGEFFANAFSQEEREVILQSTISTPAYETIAGGKDTMDRVFLLSRSEAANYFSGSEDRRVEPTEYARTMGAATADENGCAWWWLRSPGEFAHDAGLVYAVGGIDHTGGNIRNSRNGIRPAIWLDLS